MISARAFPWSQPTSAYQPSRRPSLAGRPIVPTLTTSVPATRRCQGMPVWVQSSRAAPLAAVRIASSSSVRDSQRKSLTASGEPWTMWTSTPAQSKRSSAGSSRIQAAKSGPVWARV